MTTPAPNAKDIFLGAVEIAAPEDRAAFLDMACEGNDELRRRVEALLQAHERPESLLDRAAFAPGEVGTLPPPPPDLAAAEGPGGRVGPYLLVEPLGEGGMGTVFLAEQSEPVRRRVALKLIKPGMDTARVIARFEVERQALALMDHPNIARVLDAGATESGRPYFVMERVHGLPVTRFCDDARLTPRQRLELFVPICQAIQHAHQKGVIHRDIKPSNVLVTEVDGKPVPKVIDFGIAKAVGRRPTGSTLLTQHGALVGTPEYMSPEQAGAGPDIDTRSDVYGLGVLLYELLTGTTPLDRDGLRRAPLDEVLERVREEEPPKPSTRLSVADGRRAAVAAVRATDPGRLAKLVRGDLDWVVMKALDKDRSRRYETASGLARDLRRYLDGEPVEARPPSRSYRLRRFVRKNRAALATAAAFALVLLVGAAVSTWQARRLHEARRVSRLQEEAIRRQAGEARIAQYVADIRRASALAATGVARSARGLLDGHQPAAGGPDLRGFEWYYLEKGLDARRTGWVGHEAREVYHVEYAPYGRTFATAGGDGTARLWEAGTGHRRLVLRGHVGDVNWVSFSPDGARLVTAGDDARVRVWDASDGRALAVLDGFGTSVVAALFTKDGRDVIAADRHGLHVRWDPATGRRRVAAGLGVSRGGEWVETLAISPDGMTAAVTGKNGYVLLWDLSRGGLDPVTRPLATMGTNGFCVAFAPDGRTLAATEGDESQAVIYDLATGEARTELKGPTGSCFTLAFAPDGRKLAVGSNGTVLRLWDLETRTSRTLPGHADRIWSVAFSPDGRTLASASRDGTIRLWDTETRPDRTVFRGLRRDPLWNQANSVAFADGGARVLASNRAGDVLSCDLATGEARVVLTADLLGNSFSSIAPDGTTIALSGQSGGGDTTSYTVTLHDLTGTRRPITLGRSLHLESWSWSPDGTRFAVFDLGGDLTLWDSKGRSLGRADFRWGAGSSRPAFLPAGGAVIAFTGNCEPAQPFRPTELVFWEPGRGRFERRRSGHDPGFSMGKIVMAPDGRSLASVGTAALWDVHPLSPRHPLIGHNDRVTDLAFAPDGRTVATTSLDHTVRLWNVAAGQDLLTLEAHSGPVRAVAFSPDGRALATCGDGPDGGVEVVVWNAGTRPGSGPVTPHPRSPRAGTLSR